MINQEEYEDKGDIGYTSEEYSEYLSKFNEMLLTKLEEEKMKKDKKWLKEEIESKFHRWYDSAQTLNSLIANVNNLIDQLDEPEVLYYIVDKNNEVLWYRDHEGVPRLSGSDLQSVLKSKSKKRYQFTEQEIKGYDKRYWPFAERVEQAEFRLLF